MKNIPGNLLKNLEKSWKYHGILSVRKSGNPVKICIILHKKNRTDCPEHFHSNNTNKATFTNVS